MPRSAGTPPDPASVVDWLSGSPVDPNAFRRSSKTRTIATGPGGVPTDRERRRRLAAGRPEWDSFQMNASPTSPTDVYGAVDLLGEDVDPNAVVNQALGYEVITYVDELGDQQITTAADYYSDESSSYLEEEGFYTGKGYTYNFDPSRGGHEINPAIASTVDKAPADITVVPTSTTNPNRPRTVAAGYDKARKCLTTVFRDGTFYNYYGVGGLEWNNFKRARSKGRFIARYLDGKVRGTADMGGVPQQHQEVLYRVARTAQVTKGGITSGQKAGSQRGGRGAYGSKNTYERSQRKMRARVEQAMTNQ